MRFMQLSDTAVVWFEEWERGWHGDPQFPLPFLYRNILYWELSDGKLYYRNALGYENKGFTPPPPTHTFKTVLQTSKLPASYSSPTSHAPHPPPNPFQSQTQFIFLSCPSWSYSTSASPLFTSPSNIRDHSRPCWVVRERIPGLLWDVGGYD